MAGEPDSILAEEALHLSFSKGPGGGTAGSWARCSPPFLAEPHCCPAFGQDGGEPVVLQSPAFLRQGRGFWVPVRQDLWGWPTGASFSLGVRSSTTPVADGLVSRAG